MRQVTSAMVAPADRGTIWICMDCGHPVEGHVVHVSYLAKGRRGVQCGELCVGCARKEGGKRIRRALKGAGLESRKRTSAFVGEGG